MRLWPLALVRRRDLDALAREAVAQSRVTHNNPAALAASALVATGIAVALEAGRARRDASNLVGEILERATLARAMPGFAYLAEEIARKRAAVAALAPAPAAAGKLEPPDLPPALRDTGGFVVDTVSTVFALLELFRWDPAASILAAATGGGDTDTLATITGALAGAHAGEAALPFTWLEGLCDERTRRQDLDWKTAPTRAQVDRLIADVCEL
jgi:ADP-ribosylglycohydrolase